MVLPFVIPVPRRAARTDLRVLAAMHRGYPAYARIIDGMPSAPVSTPATLRDRAVWWSWGELADACSGQLNRACQAMARPTTSCMRPVAAVMNERAT
jgi:hypothetical protein